MDCETRKSTLMGHVWQQEETGTATTERETKTDRETESTQVQVSITQSLIHAYEPQTRKPSNPSGSKKQQGPCPIAWASSPNQA